MKRNPLEATLLRVLYKHRSHRVNKRRQKAYWDQHKRRSFKRWLKAIERDFAMKPASGWAMGQGREEGDER